MEDKKYNFKVGQVFQRSGCYRVIFSLNNNMYIIKDSDGSTVNNTDYRGLKRQFDNDYYNFPKPPEVNSKRKNYEIF